MKHTLFISSFENNAIKDIDLKLMHKYIIDDFENYWFSNTNDTEIQYFEDNELERVHIKTASKIIASMITERKTTSSLS